MADVEHPRGADPTANFFLFEQGFDSFGFPAQRGDLGAGSFVSTTDLEGAAETIALARAALVVDNDAVHGIVVDGEQVPSDAKAQIRDLKGHASDGQRPYGLIIPHQRFANLVDHTKVAESARDLIEDPDKFASRLGAITFVRVAADSEALVREEVPACAVSTDSNGQEWVQNYDPAGGMLEGLTHAAAELEVRYPVITSLNRGGESEVVDPVVAQGMVDATGMAYLADPFAARIVTGSYPIIQADERGLRLVREGCIGTTILRSLLDGHELVVPDDVLPAKYPPLEQDDVPELQGLKGPELRDALLQHWGWRTRVPERLSFQPSSRPI